MNIIRGDLIELAKAGIFDVIIHGCNCQCRMGRGIALTIKQQFPEAYAADCQTEIGDRNKLGTFTSVDIDRDGFNFTIVNGYTQFHWQGEGVLADYDAIRSVFRSVKQKFAGKRIGYPKIGAGLAKGDWEIIAAIVESELAGENHTYVEFVSQ
ncbi:macro domain-containing protein [Chamaesiphon minutus]|uniref:Putative phosphatase, C-terminal domain of histone macro H2A1 like protein n=1 Tax=Chamaesiphon minutus (strain ATCC 27169 / PCC 6605) TaxID=1173020 RepID=K9UMH5_CHAP6|nr:macro domain-containing protein [Chamaesiphon minutus]AFY95651.1 putative phosphatase, C-terminal domain of histone macro H2A1 like protein [Chamaesiphon minutus PCC 6605]